MITAILEWGAAPSGVSYGALLEAFGVGVGLYLALAIIQAVAGFRISILTRRLESLRKAVLARKMQGEYGPLRSLAGRLANVEIQLDGFFDTLFKAIVVAFSVAIGSFTNALIWQEAILWNWALYLSLAFLLWCPLVIFFASAAYIRTRCSPIEGEIKKLSSRVQTKLFQLQPST